MAQPVSDEALQLRKRARRRLVGAIALVALVVLVVPWFIDTAPPPPLKDVEIVIPPVPPADKQFPPDSHGDRMPHLILTLRRASVALLMAAPLAAQAPEKVDHAALARIRDEGMNRSKVMEKMGVGSVAELVRALANGAVLRDPVWRRRACAALGALLMFLGVFGAMIVVVPLALKIVLAGVMLYCVVRVAWALKRSTS